MATGSLFLPARHTVVNFYNFIAERPSALLNPQRRDYARHAHYTRIGARPNKKAAPRQIAQGWQATSD